MRERALDFKELRNVLGIGGLHVNWYPYGLHTGRCLCHDSKI